MKRLIPCVLLVVAVLGCRDLRRFSSHGDHFEGTIAVADFVRSGFTIGTKLCLTLDTDHLELLPGMLSTSDGRFHDTPLRTIPQTFHDPISTLSFGEGRIRNLLYMAKPNEDGGADMLVIVSLMQSNDVEVRLIRGAPDQTTGQTHDFGVFYLTRSGGACSF